MARFPAPGTTWPEGNNIFQDVGQLFQRWKKKRNEMRKRKMVYTGCDHAEDGIAGNRGQVCACGRKQNTEYNPSFLMFDGTDHRTYLGRQLLHVPQWDYNKAVSRNRNGSTKIFSTSLSLSLSRFLRVSLQSSQGVFAIPFLFFALRRHSVYHGCFSRRGTISSRSRVRCSRGSNGLAR